MTEFNILGLSPATVAMLLEAIYRTGADIEPVVRIYRNTEEQSKIQFEVPGLNVTIHGPDNHLPEAMSNAILGVYRPATKQVVLENFSKHIASPSFCRVIHPSAAVASTADIGDGVFVNANVSVAPYVILGQHVTVNRNASVGHHTSVGDFCTINPGAHIAGHCVLEESVTIGMGASVADGVSIGQGSVIGAGSVVVKDIPPGVKAYGIPCKVIGEV